MGTSMAPYFSNVFMAGIEERFLARQAVKRLTWIRYIHHIFMVWNGTGIELNSFLRDLNDEHPPSSLLGRSTIRARSCPTWLSTRETDFTQKACSHRDALQTFNTYTSLQTTYNPTRRPWTVLGECVLFLRSTFDRNTYEGIVRRYKQRMRRRAYLPGLIKRFSDKVPFSRRACALLARP